MIPGDIGAEITRLLRAAVAAGELPEQAAAGYRPPEPGGRPRPRPTAARVRYATSLPLAVASMAGRAAEPVAERCSRPGWPRCRGSAPRG